MNLNPDLEAEAPEEDDLRNDLDAAFDAVEVSPQEMPDKPEGEAPAPRDDGRDENGRFAPKKPDTEVAPDGAAPKVEGEKAAAAPPAVAAPPVAGPEDRAPQSWKPAARETWAKLPVEARQEVMRREREVSVAMQESAEARHLASSVRDTVNPYLGMIRAEGGEPLQVIGNLLQTAAALRTAPPQHKAQLVAQLIKGYGIDVGMLDAILVGQAPPAGQPQAQAPRPEQFRDPRLDQIIEQQRRAIADNTRRSVETFATKHEFYEDVRETMADILDLNDRQNEARARRGEQQVDMDLETAYSRAVQLDPQLSKVVAQREAAKAAQTGAQATARSRRASSSVASSPVGAVTGKKREGSLRDDLEDSLEDLSGR